MHDRAIYHCCWFSPRKPDQRLKASHVRDGKACSELQATMATRGFEYGGPLFNFPPLKTVLPTDPWPDERLEVDTSFIGSEDIVCVVTRPPIDDLGYTDRIRVERAFTTLEDDVFAVTLKYLKHCARSHVQLRKRFAGQLPKGYENRANIQFYQTGDECCCYHSLGRLKVKPIQGTEDDRRLTAAYLIREKELWKGGPELLAAFGMSGDATLAWAHRLRTDYTHLLDGYGLTMVEMVAPPVPERTTNLDFAKKWDVTVLLEHCEAA